MRNENVGKSAEDATDAIGKALDSDAITAGAPVVGRMIQDRAHYKIQIDAAAAKLQRKLGRGGGGGDQGDDTEG